VQPKFHIDDVFDHSLKTCDIAEDKIKLAALLHDIGNIVKFDFFNHPEFLGKEQKNVKKWIQIQKEMIQKYGTDDHEALSNILKELKVDKKLSNLIMAKVFKNSKKMALGNNWKVIYPLS
jgi:HD superfamily phosphohydrolase